MPEPPPVCGPDDRLLAICCMIFLGFADDVLSCAGAMAAAHSCLTTSPHGLFHQLWQHDHCGAQALQPDPWPASGLG